MNLNAFTVFGNRVNFSTGGALAIMIILAVVLLLLILVLIFQLIKTLKKKPAAETVVVTAQQPVAPEVTIIYENQVVEEPPVQEPVVVVQEAQPQPEPEPEPQKVVVKEVNVYNVYNVYDVKKSEEEEDLEDEESETASVLYEVDDDGTPITRHFIPDVIPAEDEESYRAGKLVYNKSFQAKYIQSPDEEKNWYIHIKNELLSYKNVKSRLSWRKETFRIGREIVAKITIRGRTLCLYLPLNPKDYDGSKYIVEDASNVVAFEDTPLLYRIRSHRRSEYACELIEKVMANIGAEKGESPDVDYYLPYEGIVELIEKDLIRRVIRN